MFLSVLATIGMALAQEPIGAERIAHDADKMRWLAQSNLSSEFLAASKGLKQEPVRVLYRHKTTREWLRESKFDQLSAQDQASYIKNELDADSFYQTKYGSPLTYLPCMNLLGKHGFGSMSGKKVLDFGYGMIGQLRIWALMGANSVGVDVDPFLRELYSMPADQGKVGMGSVRLVHGFFPSDPAVAQSVGSAYDLFISKNTLKRGYIHPTREAPKAQLIDLGVTDEQFVMEVWNRLKPGGYALIYNISPPQNPLDKPYIPWADGETAFERSIWEKHGFEVLAFDEKDDVTCLATFRALGYDSGPEPITKSVFTHYSLMRKR